MTDATDSEVQQYLAGQLFERSTDNGDVAEPLRGPSVSEREQWMVKAYTHVFRDEWFDAIAAFEYLLTKTDTPPAEFLSSYATCLMNVGRAREAAEAYERCVPLRPEKSILEENAIFCRDQCDDTTAAEAYARRREYWTAHMKVIADNRVTTHENNRDPERPLRIGYLSADFRSHSANMSFGFVVMRHTPAVEAYCYSTAHPHQWDQFTTIYSQERVFRVLDGLHEKTAADIIRRDKIDILVDLAGFSNGSRLGLLALKPAPIQVTAWGYVLGTGMDTVDVIFGDQYAMPYSNQEFYRERIVHLPTIIPFCGQVYSPEVTLLPCLQARGPYPFTFGCYNRAAKIGDTALRMWSKILKATTDTRLILKEAQIIHPYHRDRVLKALDVNPDRVIFQGQSSHPKHLEAYAQIDLALDPYPIAGGVSMLEGLWMGVPALVRKPLPEHQRVVSLVGYSALRTLGMDDFIGQTEDDYVRLAVRWATEGRDTLSQWRLQLRKLVFNSALIQGYVESVEDTYRDLWRQYLTKGHVGL